MATVTRENIGLLNDKITVKVAKDDYLPSFEKALKQYSKTANIPGFRKGYGAYRHDQEDARSVSFH